MRVNRRAFIAAGGAAALTVLAPVSASAGWFPRPPRKRKHRRIYRLSVRGRRASGATKAFCANMRFKDRTTAKRYPRPHAGTHARIVPIDISYNEYVRLFMSRHSRVADLRHLRFIKVVG